MSAEIEVIQKMDLSSFCTLMKLPVIFCHKAAEESKDNFLKKFTTRARSR